MRQPFRWRWFLDTYRGLPMLVRRKAEISLVVSLLLTGLVAVNLAIRLAAGRPSAGVGLVLAVVLLVAGWAMLVKGRLEAHVNFMALLLFLQCALVFNEELTRQFFVLSLFSMIVFAVLSVRRYQKLIAFLLFPGLVATKGAFELWRAGQEGSGPNTVEGTLFTLLVFAAAVPLVNLIMAIVGREVQHSEILLGRNETLKREAGTDRLTGIWNRRAFERLVRRETSEAKRTGRPLALALFDLDHFKRINDQWGHQTGDDALVEATRAVAGVLRQGDSLVRWGGDEFVILCPGVGPLEAPGLGEKIVAAIRDHPGAARWNWGVSVGIAVWSEGEGVASLLARADRLLYEAKMAGRGRAITG